MLDRQCHKDMDKNDNNPWKLLDQDKKWIRVAQKEVNMFLIPDLSPLVMDYIPLEKSIVIYDRRLQTIISFVISCPLIFTASIFLLYFSVKHKFNLWGLFLCFAIIGILWACIYVYAIIIACMYTSKSFTFRQLDMIQTDLFGRQTVLTYANMTSFQITPSNKLVISYPSKKDYELFFNGERWGIISDLSRTMFQQPPV